MRSRSLKLIRRFWPGLLCLAVTFLLLAWGLEPQPRSIVSFPFDGSVCKLDHVISPDGKFLATRARGYITGVGGPKAIFALHEISSQREIFIRYDSVWEFRFDSDGSLAYLVFEQSREKGKKDKLQLHRWRPDTQQSQMVWEHEAVDPQTTQRTIAYLSNSTVSNVSRLSPDSRTLLFATYQKGELHGELLDGLTGKVRNDFTLTKSQSGEMLLPEVQAVFTSDNKMVVLQTCEINESGLGHHWHWIDVQSGKVVQTVLIPPELIIEEILFATATTPVAKASNRQGDRFLVSVNKKEVQAAQFEETKPSETMNKEQGKITTHINYHGFPEHNVVYYDWYYGREPINKHHMPVFFGERRWGVREITSGKLIHTDCLSHDDSSDDHTGIRYRFFTVLSNQFLLFQENDNAKPGILLGWLAKVRAWLGVDQDLIRFQMVDGTNGKFLQRIHVPGGQPAVFLSQDGNSLIVVSGNDTRIEVRKYDFPLHQPWLLIWTWALGVAAATTLLVEARRWWRHRKNVQSPYCSSSHGG